MKYIVALILLIIIPSCSLIKKIAGADIDPLQFEKAREAKMLEIRSEYAGKMATKVIEKSIDKNDLSITFSHKFLNQILNQYIGSKGELDKNTSYTITDISSKLNYGSAIISLDMEAYNKQHNVTVLLSMDCILAFAIEKNHITIKFEPFNISPTAITKGLLASAGEIIENMVKINLAELSKKFEPIKLPINFNNKFEIKETSVTIKEKINAKINIPERIINYNISVADVLVFPENIVILFNINQISIK